MENNNYSRSKIVCTIGPSSWDPEVMGRMIAAGMNVARINGAFADREEMLKVENLVKEHSDRVGMMIDIKGPEVRLNKFPEPKKLEAGMEFEIGNSEEFEIYPANYPNTYQKMTPGQKIVVGDGDVSFTVVEVLENRFIVKVDYGEILKPGKALNFPGLRLNDNPLTEKDIDLLEYAMERNWAYVSASFIRNANDALVIREKIGDNKIELIAKIEDAEGVENIHEILKVVDGVMVARGGLGVEIDLEHVPIVQRKIIRAAIGAGKPVITATQMLDSMERNIIPTRAEANDVATAILLGSDAVMLSGESTAGKYPAQAVEFMSKVDRVATELIEPGVVRRDLPEIHGHRELSLFTEMVFRLLSERQNIKGIVYTCKNRHHISMLARHHIETPIFAFVDDQVTAQQIMLRKNVANSFVVDDELNDREDAIEHMKQRVHNESLFNDGDEYLLIIDLFQQDTAFPEIFEIVKY